eukprot:4697484-Pyramimonas_sp.AAC.1
MPPLPHFCLLDWRLSRPTSAAQHSHAGTGDGWSNVFYMLYTAALTAGLLLMRLVFKEVMQISIDHHESMEKDKLLKEAPLHSTRVDTR